MQRFSFPISHSTQIVFERHRRTRRIISKLSPIARKNLFWSIYEPKNFGDWLTPYLFFQITGKTPVFQKPSRFNSTIFGAGSIFRHIKYPNSAIVWGSGLISKDDAFKAPKQILAVRGPLTKKILEERSTKCPESFGDPGLMLARVFQPKGITKKYALGVIPHFRELDTFKEQHSDILETDEVHLIDPTQPIEEVVKQIMACERIVSSSLHGIIISHAYGVRCGWVRFSPAWNKKIDGDDIKFHDHFSAIGIENDKKALLSVAAGNTSARNLLDHAATSPLPDPTPLIDNLQRTCPFS